VREEAGHDDEYHRFTSRRVRGAHFRRLRQLRAVLVFREWRTAAAIVAVNRDGDGYAITPLFVSVTPSLTLTDHDCQTASAAPP
jgi:hypothetical protein